MALELAISAYAAPHFEPVRPGEYRCYYQSDVDDSLQPYHVYVPRHYRPDQAAPVVMSLHGFGGRTRPSARWEQAWADAETWILVSPDGRGNQNWDSIGEDDIYAVLADLQRATAWHPALNVDHERLYLQGCSMGGHGAYRQATRHPGRFAAVAAGAGWTTYHDFYAHWYECAEGPSLPKYVDPARLPQLRTASSLQQASNAMWEWMLISYDHNDYINPSENAEWFVESLQDAGNLRHQVQAGWRGHCGSFNPRQSYAFFRGKSRQQSPPLVRFVTADLRYNRSYWVSIDQFQKQGRGGIYAQADGRNVSVWLHNVEAFSLDLTRAPLSSGQIDVRINGAAPQTVDRKTVRFAAQYDKTFNPRAWQLADPPDARAHEKNSQRCGPLADAFRSRFLIIYGDRAGQEPTANPDWQAAQRLASEWNAWMTLHWGREKPPSDRLDNWWHPPYPFASGRHVAANTPLVKPVPASAFNLKTLPTDRNLILIGDPASNWIIDQFRGTLPLPIQAVGGSSVVRVGNQRFAGPHVNYTFVAPHPMSEQHYLVVSRGWLSSEIDAAKWTARQYGKDLEALPFYWPDFVIWDGGRKAPYGVQPPLRHLPDVFLAAGYFDRKWRLEREPPQVQFQVDGTTVQKAAWTSPRPAHVAIATAEPPGGFGMHKVEYRVDNGPWLPYRRPFTVTGHGRVDITARASSKSGWYVYSDATGTATAAPGQATTATLRLAEKP